MPYEWHGPARIAHRGGGSLAPENTLAAIRTGIAHGYRAVEFDVMLTADDVPILMHDPQRGRTVPGRGAVGSMSWAELAKLDAGSWCSSEFTGERVPRYEDVVRFCVASGVWMNVEIKPSPGQAERTGRIVGDTTIALIDELDLPLDRLLFSSFDTDALAAARTAAPNVARSLLVDRVDANVVPAAADLGCVGIHVDQATLDEAVIARLHEDGFAVLAYTVNRLERAIRLAAAGLDGLFTDRIDLLAFAGSSKN